MPATRMVIKMIEKMVQLCDPEVEKFIVEEVEKIIHFMLEHLLRKQRRAINDSQIHPEGDQTPGQIA